MSNKRYRRRSEFRTRIFPGVRDRMWPLLMEFGIPTEWGFRAEVKGADITDDPKFHDYSLEFFALDPATVGDAGKTSMVYPLEDGRELYVWVWRLLCEPRTRVTYQELWCANLWPGTQKPTGWQSWIVATLVPREDVKRETALLLDGLPLFDKFQERSNGYSREQAAEIFFRAAELYAENEPDAPRFNVKHWVSVYMSGLRGGYPVSRENAYYYFKKYKGLRQEVIDRFTKRQRELQDGGMCKSN
jgi:hypothetical protein